MHQNPNNPNGEPHGSPTNPSATGYESLMGSLISPGPATPVQGVFAPPWPAMSAWPNPVNYEYGMPFRQQSVEPNAFQQNGQHEDYTPFEDAEQIFTVDDTDMFQGEQMKESPPVFHPTSLSKVQDSAKRAVELRAQLLAKRDGTATPKEKRASEATPAKPQELTSKKDMNTALDGLFAEVREAVRKPVSPLELSDGEIHEDIAEGKSKSPKEDEDTEKLHRQNQVQQTYKPLDRPKPPKSQRSTLENNGRKPPENDGRKHRTQSSNMAHPSSRPKELKAYSPTTQRKHEVEPDQDLEDWLELTEYYDEEFRKKRLSLHRRKKALEAQRLELEREEQLELEERSIFARSKSDFSSTSSQPSSRVKMPPPPLPLRETNHEVKANSIGTPKRRFFEDSTDDCGQQGVRKTARLDLNGRDSGSVPNTPIAIKQESRNTSTKPVSLASRVTRDDGQFQYQSWRRSRSPTYRRRSVSPDRRRFARGCSPDQRRRSQPDAFIPEQRYIRKCHNCNREGHIQTECLEPRRDGQDRDVGTSKGTYQHYGISPNYQGKHPIPGGPHRRPRGGGDDIRSRHNSVGRMEEEKAAKEIDSKP